MHLRPDVLQEAGYDTEEGQRAVVLEMIKMKLSMILQGKENDTTLKSMLGLVGDVPDYIPSPVSEDIGTVKLALQLLQNKTLDGESLEKSEAAYKQIMEERTLPVCNFILSWTNGEKLLKSIEPVVTGMKAGLGKYRSLQSVLSEALAVFAQDKDRLNFTDQCTVQTHRLDKLVKIYTDTGDIELFYLQSEGSEKQLQEYMLGLLDMVICAFHECVELTCKQLGDLQPEAAALDHTAWDESVTTKWSGRIKAYKKIRDAVLSLPRVTPVLKALKDHEGALQVCRFL